MMPSLMKDAVIENWPMRLKSGVAKILLGITAVPAMKDVLS